MYLPWKHEIRYENHLKRFIKQLITTNLHSNQCTTCISKWRPRAFLVIYRRHACAVRSADGNAQIFEYLK